MGMWTFVRMCVCGVCEVCVCLFVRRCAFDCFCVCEDVSLFAFVFVSCVCLLVCVCLLMLL